MLDAVETRGETFVVVRNGRPVARVGPAPAAHGAAVKEALRAHGRDAAWADELRALLVAAGFVLMVDGSRVPRLASQAALRILARHGVPTRR